MRQGQRPAVLYSLEELTHMQRLGLEIGQIKLMQSCGQVVWLANEFENHGDSQLGSFDFLLAGTHSTLALCELVYGFDIRIAHSGNSPRGC